MAFDGVTVSAIVSELKKNLTGGRIYKIYQPEVDELCLVVKKRTEQGNTTSRLVISADASLPLIYLTGQIKENQPVLIFPLFEQRKTGAALPEIDVRDLDPYFFTDRIAFF